MKAKLLIYYSVSLPSPIVTSLCSDWKNEIADFSSRNELSLKASLTLRDSVQSLVVWE